MVERKLKRQQRTTGAVVKIPLENGYHSYARILDVDIAFYDIRTKEELTVDKIVKLPVLFITTVYDDAIVKGYWTKVGKKLPLENHLINTPPKYTQDILNPDKFTLVYNDKQVEASKEACKGLEFWTIWQTEKIEERLNNHFSSKENAFVHRMKKGEMYPNSPEIKESIAKTIRNLRKESV